MVRSQERKAPRWPEYFLPPWLEHRLNLERGAEVSSEPDLRERVPIDHYWVPGCPVGPAGYTFQSQSRCTPSGDASYTALRGILTTLARTGPGAFVLRRTWDQSTPRSCTDERFGAYPLALPNSFVTSGSGMGGTFTYHRYECTYTLTKK